jgi:hypothetical protein
MKEKEMNKATRPRNRQNNNKARELPFLEKGLLVGWMTEGCSTW